MKLMTGKRQWMYPACGMIALAGACVFGILMLMVEELVMMEPVAAEHAAGIYCYTAGAMVPCMAALGMLLAVARGVGRDQSFTARNAGWMRGIAGMALLECIYIIAGVFGWAAVGLMNPSAVILAFVLVLLGAGIGLLAWTLAGLIEKASVIREENELTV